MKTFWIQAFDHAGGKLPLREVQAASLKDAEARIEEMYGKIFGGGSPLKMDVIEAGSVRKYLGIE